jgi:hypothetical protein
MSGDYVYSTVIPPLLNFEVKVRFSQLTISGEGKKNPLIEVSLYVTISKE